MLGIFSLIWILTLQAIKSSVCLVYIAACNTLPQRSLWASQATAAGTKAQYADSDAEPTLPDSTRSREQQFDPGRQKTAKLGLCVCKIANGMQAQRKKHLEKFRKIPGISCNI